MKSWPLLLVGALLGLAGGLVYTWVLAPPTYENIYPPLMSSAHRQDWIRMTALAYGAEGNTSRTELRLLDMPTSEVRQVTAQVLEDAVARGRDLVTLQRLAELAQVYGVDSPAVRVYTEGDTLTVVPSTPTPFAPTEPPTVVPSTLTPTPSPTVPAPTLELSPLPASPYEVVSQTLVCADSPWIGISLVVSRTVTERRRTESVQEPVTGQDLWLTWEDGADKATTGFKPELGPGYADFDVEPGHVYRLYVGMPIGQPLATIQVEPCNPSEGGGWIARSLIVMEEVLESEE